MLFTNKHLQEASAFAAQQFEAVRHLSASDQKRALLAACDPHADILLAVAALGEFDRLSGERQLPPIEVVDLMTHYLPTTEKELAAASIVCHGDHCMQFALWYARQGARVFCSARQDYIPCLSALAGGEITFFQEFDETPSDAFHIALFNTGAGDHAGPFLRQFLKSDSRGGVVMTNWSFLSTSSPRTLQIKQRLIESGCLRSVTQLPKGVMPRALPALLQLGPKRADVTSVRLVNARDWFVIGSHGAPEVSYLNPILVQAGILPPTVIQAWTPRPPAEEVSVAALLGRNCDLRPHDAPADTATPTHRIESLSSCASLVRGQMLAKSTSPEPSRPLYEVTLADIDEMGFVTQASRLIDNAAPLPRARRLALLRPGDILIACKGSLQSLGKVGLITQCGTDWLPNQTFYLIRSESIDPLWLFHYLRSPQAQNYLKVRSSGTSVPQIQIGDIAAMGIPVPTEDDLHRVHELHASLIKIRQKITKYRDDAKEKAEQFTASMWGQPTLA